MALYIDCDRCGSELNYPLSALVFSPPSKFGSAVTKYYICEDCFYDLNEWMKNS